MLLELCQMSNALQDVASDKNLQLLIQRHRLHATGLSWYSHQHAFNIREIWSVCNISPIAVSIFQFQSNSRHTVLRVENPAEPPKQPKVPKWCFQNSSVWTCNVTWHSQLCFVYAIISFTKARAINRLKILKGILRILATAIGPGFPITTFLYLHRTLTRREIFFDSTPDFDAGHFLQHHFHYSHQNLIILALTRCQFNLQLNSWFCTQDTFSHINFTIRIRTW